MRKIERYQMKAAVVGTRPTDDVGRRRSKEAVNRSVAVSRAPAPFRPLKVGPIVAVLLFSRLARLASRTPSLIVRGQTAMTAKA